MSAQKYSVIVFDLGNVLLNFDYNIAVEKLDKIEFGLGKKFLEYHKSNYHIHRSFEKGEIDEKQFIKRALAAVDYKVDAESFCKIYSEIFTPNDKVISLLPKLKKKYELILLSNTDPLHKKYGWESYSFLPYFDHKVLSFEVGAAKPEAKIYETVERLSKVVPQEHLYIDDIADYVAMAKKLSWDSIQFLNYNQLYSELNVRGVFSVGE